MLVPVALYREYRPRTFAEIVAQEHVSRTLLNALNENRLSHAYLFCGPRGTGKTSTARVLAKALNCPNAVMGQPCGECPECQSIARGEGVDVSEMDAASNRGIEEIRTLRDRIRLAPVSGKYKVYVIDEVHMLTNEAFNALLKTLEEPPTNVVFILCTTEAYRVPPTILSRCQRFDFHRLPTEAIVSHLAAVTGKLDRDVDPAALRAIGRAATGSMRDALSILDQCLAYTQDRVTLGDARAVLGAMDAGVFGELTDAVLAGDVASTWRLLGQLLEHGRDPREVARALGHHFRDLLLIRLAGDRGEATGPLADDPQRLAAQAGSVSDRLLYDAIDLFSSADAELRLAHQPRLVLEARLVKLCASMPAAGHAAPEGGAQDGVSSEATACPVARPPSRRRTPAGAARPSRPAPASHLETAAPPLPEPPPEDPDANLQPEAEGKPDRHVADGPAGGPASGDADGVSSAAKPAAAGPEQAPPPQDDPAAPVAVSPALLDRAWRGALAQLPDTSSGYLANAVPEWDGRRVCVWLPEGMEFMADYLGGKDTCRRLAETMGPTIGAAVNVVIQVRSRQSLFDSPDRGNPQVAAEQQGRGGREARGSEGGHGAQEVKSAKGAPVKGPTPEEADRTPPAAPAPEQGPGGSNQVRSSRADTNDDDEDLREAQLMFRAEDVSKGDEDR